MLNSEEICLINPSTDNIFDRPRSLRWQMLQGIHYIIGGLCFTIGSCMFFTDVFRAHPAALTIGGWLFTMGSSVYLLADLQNWWDYRTGYCFNHPLSDNQNLDLSVTSSNQNDREEIEINVYGTLCGAIFYLAGSILFIPVFATYIIIGEWFFIFGSTFCYLSLIWKTYRLACINLHDSFDHRFRLFNLLNDLPALIIDSLSVLGNICFFIGTILFLPYLNKTDFDENRAAFFFVFGSICFTLTSLIVQFTICCSHRR